MNTDLLTGLTTAPDRAVTDHPLLTAAEQDRILNDLNPYARPVTGYRTMAEPFEEQVRRTPGATAVVTEDGHALSYQDLNSQANKLAHFLRAAGAGRGTRVALALERGIPQIVALYAVAKSGAAYVPLDTELPDVRLRFMLEDTEPVLVLTDTESRPRIADGPWRVVDVGADCSAWADAPAGDVAVTGPENHLVHLLYTSGSTGRPKAVAYPVDGAIANILWLQRFYPFTDGDTALFKTSYGFDVSIWEIFWPLYFGAKVVVCRPGGHRDPRHLVEAMDRHDVTTIFLIPTIMQPVLEHLTPDRCRGLRWVFCGGEPVTPRIRDTFHQLSAAKLINCYGPTEAGCVTDMVLPSDPGAPTVPLGRPAAHFRLYVLDEELRVCPAGVPGEAFLGGEVGVAQAYWRRPEQTAERFLPDPYGPPGSRMYRTGDLCRYHDDGVLDHLGRIDRQVKVRGQRIELSEIEAVLVEHPAVRDCVVLMADGPNGPRMLAFVVPADGSMLDTDDVAAHARELLPQHMLPERIQPIDRIPANVNGKTDHRALLAQLEPDIEDDREIVAPRTEFESRLAEIFQRVLEVDRVGITDNFVELGGHSLLAFTLIEICGEELGAEPDVTDLLTATVGELAESMQSTQDTTASHLIPLYPRPDKPVLVFVHAVSGSALPFVATARRLREHFSIYALQTTDRTPGPLPASVEAFAARYLELVEPLRDERPLILAGWSMGGCVAMEMAREWRARGVEVDAILLLDTLVPPPVLAAESEQDQARQAILDMDIIELEGGGADLLRQVLDSNRLAFLDYKPAWFDGHVTLLRAAEEFPGADALPQPYFSDDRGWRSRISRVTTVSIPGNHFTLLAEQYADTLAETILSAL